MNQHEFIHNELFPLLTFHSRQLIANYTSSQFNPDKYIEVLTTRKMNLQVEINNLEEVLRRLKGIK